MNVTKYKESIRDNFDMSCNRNFPYGFVSHSFDVNYYFNTL